MSLSILIIGGSGFLSGTLARVAVSAGHKVYTVTRGQRPPVADTRSLVADRKDHAAFANAVHSVNQSWDLVVDCIGFDPSDAEQDIELFSTLANYFVFVSTDFVYDPPRRQFPQPEDAEGYFVDVAPDSYGGKKRLYELTFVNGDTGSMQWTIIRPGHIYGPGSLLGCLPPHGRDAELINRLRRGETIPLVGGGHFLQQPVFAPDLADLILSLPGNESCHQQIYGTVGPDIIESRTYYQIIATILGTELQIEEVPVGAYLAENPGQASFICHRFYDINLNSGLEKRKKHLSLLVK
ncbi:NAD-dependent epimerase/dehydratase family protein [Chloroflexi bacterium TSY]|nr:NAD-dependent epimerase/dehydratase family protein [Chloroflexi bacterium TSY]